VTGEPSAKGSDHQLRQYWTHGEGAAKIGWGTPGDFDRCVMHLGKYVTDPKGLCAEYHHGATGEWPAEHAAREHGKADALTAEELSFLDEMRVKHLPGQHNQQDHGHHGADLSDALDGLTVYTADEYFDDFGEEVYGERTSETGIAPRFFESGDIHLALDLEGEHHQVLAPVESPMMLRDLASDLRALLKTDVTRLDDEDGEPEDGIVDSFPGFSGVAAARYDTGDIRLTALDEGVELDISEAEAAELAGALDNVAEVWEREFGTADGKTARRVRRKHLPGLHDQSSHGRRRGSRVSGAVADAIRLTPEAAREMQRTMLADRPWTRGQKDALNGYSALDYLDINRVLRNPDTLDEDEDFADMRRDVEKQITTLQGALRPLPAPVTVTRMAHFSAYGITTKPPQAIKSLNTR